MKHIALMGFLAATFLVGSTAQAIDIIWDGGDGNWESANWNTGQTALEVLGTVRGLNVGNGELGTDVFINGGNVNFDAEVNDDFRWQDNPNSGSGTLNLSGGATLTIDTAPPGDADGHWSQFNTKALNIDNATFRRTFTPTAAGEVGTVLSGGVFSFAGVAANDGIDTEINLTNGGRIENDGILAFGWYQNSYANIRVAMTINDGDLDLTGGSNFDFLGGAAGGAGNPDLLIHRGWDNINNAPAAEDYSINFTGPGSITVDSSGILIVDKIGAGGFDYDFSTITTLVTYEDLWDEGILQANGLSGVDGAAFASNFSVVGSSGSDDYILTSLLSPAGPDGDFDGDGDVDGNDFLTWQRDDATVPGLANWESDYGTPAPLSGLAAASVPEPASGVLLMFGLSAMLLRRKATA